MYLVAIAVAAVFLGLGLWHFHLARRRPDATSGVIPSADGQPLFVPSRQSTIAVGLILWLLAGLVAATGGVIPSALPPSWLAGACWLLALGLLARAIGEFRYVGLFKRVRGTRFATLDSWVYSPLCLALAASVAYIAGQSGHG